jgi:hypothetical protein
MLTIPWTPLALSGGDTLGAYPLEHLVKLQAVAVEAPSLAKVPADGHDRLAHRP